jgi:hypothetical protein
MKNDHDQHYSDLLHGLLTPAQELSWQEAENNPSGNNTFIIRTDPNRMSQKRNEVKRRYDKRRNHGK